MSSSLHLYTFLASTSVYDTITEQGFETTGRGLQSHYYMVAEGFISIEARSGHRLVYVLVNSQRLQHTIFLLSILITGRYIIKMYVNASKDVLLLSIVQGLVS